MSTLLAARSASTSVHHRPFPRRPTGAHRHAAAPSLFGLGLASETAVNGSLQRLHGLRRGAMVEIRFPVDGLPVAAAPVGSFPVDVESATWLCVASMPFRCILGATVAVPRAIAAAIGDVPLAAPIWQGVELSGSAVGIVAVR